MEWVPKTWWDLWHARNGSLDREVRKSQRNWKALERGSRREPRGEAGVPRTICSASHLHPCLYHCPSLSRMLQPLLTRRFPGQDVHLACTQSVSLLPAHGLRLRLAHVANSAPELRIILGRHPAKCTMWESTQHQPEAWKSKCGKFTFLWETAKHLTLFLSSSEQACFESQLLESTPASLVCLKYSSVKECSLIFEHVISLSSRSVQQSGKNSLHLQVHSRKERYPIFPHRDWRREWDSWCGGRKAPGHQSKFVRKRIKWMVENAHMGTILKFWCSLIQN